MNSKEEMDLVLNKVLLAAQTVGIILNQINVNSIKIGSFSWVIVSLQKGFGGYR